jgi:(2Fe-2S) ferredoxin
MSRGAQDVYTEIALAVEREALDEAVVQTVAGCVGPLCGRGPVVCSYPSGAWYAAVAPTDAAEIVRDDLGAGRPVERLMAMRVSD